MGRRFSKSPAIGKGSQNTLNVANRHYVATSPYGTSAHRPFCGNLAPMIPRALRKRRNEIVAEIRKLQRDLAHLDAAMKLMESEYKAPRANHGLITRQVYAVLRDAKQPLTARDVAELTHLGVQQVEDALKSQRRKGLVRGTKESGKWIGWEIVMRGA